MLTIFRRHLKTCKFAAKGRRHRHCNCPLAVEGRLHGAIVRQSLDLRSWEAAQKLVRDWEIQGKKPVTVDEAADRFLTDRESSGLGAAQLGKYKNVVSELKAAVGSMPLRNVSVDDIRRIKESWKLSPITVQKRLERVQKFFTFCVDSEWLERNPAKRVKLPPAKYDPTMPFTDEEMEKILWAAEYIREAHPKVPERTPAKLVALILLMRYAGLRISDACMFRSAQISDGKIFLRQEKTKQPVWVPVPDRVTIAIEAVDEGREFLFYDRAGKPKSCITEWQQRLKLVYEFAGIPDGHSHRLRDTFSVVLLSKGVPIDVVSVLLGHTSIKTTEKHYAPWVKSRQMKLEEAVRSAW
ncbi:MAG TPA: tyrosine-type recombinase/integrase [Terracidiphilus sp.]|nr:tyrosine-type recombinase/integrase [Terracidiphilus sp.]